MILSQTVSDLIKRTNGNLNSNKKEEKSQNFETKLEI